MLQLNNVNSKYSNENILELALPVILAGIGFLLSYLGDKLINSIANKSGASFSSTDETTAILEDYTKFEAYMKLYYPKICEFIKQHKQDDAFYFKDIHGLHPINTIIHAQTMISTDLDKFVQYTPSSNLNPPNSKDEFDGDFSNNFADDFRNYMNKFPSANYNPPEDIETTYEKAGYLNANSVLRSINLEHKCYDKLSKLTKCFKTILKKYDISEDLQEAYIEDLYETAFGTQSHIDSMFDYPYYLLRAILKHVKNDFENYNK